MPKHPKEACQQSAGGVAVFNHVPGGANVLYMDGHVEFQKYQITANPAADASGTEKQLFPVSTAWAMITRTANDAGL